MIANFDFILYIFPTRTDVTVSSHPRSDLEAKVKVRNIKIRIKGF